MHNKVKFSCYANILFFDTIRKNCSVSRGMPNRSRTITSYHRHPVTRKHRRLSCYVCRVLYIRQNVLHCTIKCFQHSQKSPSSRRGVPRTAATKYHHIIADCRHPATRKHRLLRPQGSICPVKHAPLQHKVSPPHQKGSMETTWRTVRRSNKKIINTAV
jgi:hypothetical protein